MTRNLRHPMCLRHPVSYSPIQYPVYVHMQARIQWQKSTRTYIQTYRFIYIHSLYHVFLHIQAQSWWQKSARIHSYIYTCIHACIKSHHIHICIHSLCHIYVTYWHESGVNSRCKYTHIYAFRLEYIIIHHIHIYTCVISCFYYTYRHESGDRSRYAWEPRMPLARERVRERERKRERKIKSKTKRERERDREKERERQRERERNVHTCTACTYAHTRPPPSAHARMHTCTYTLRRVTSTHVYVSTQTDTQVQFCGEVGGWGRDPFSRNFMKPTPRRKWYLSTGRRFHWMVLDPIPQSLPVHFFGSRPQPPTSRSARWKAACLKVCSTTFYLCNEKQQLCTQKKKTWVGVTRKYFFLVWMWLIRNQMALHFSEMPGVESAVVCVYTQIVGNRTLKWVHVFAFAHLSKLFHEVVTKRRLSTVRPQSWLVFQKSPVK